MSSSSSSSWWIWRPQIPDSIDGRPLVTTIPELWPTQFPYHRLPDRNNNNNNTEWSWWISLSLRPEIVIGSMILFVLTLPLLKIFRDQVLFRQEEQEKQQQDSKNQRRMMERIRQLTAIHNFILAIFSLVCAWNVYAIIGERIVRQDGTGGIYSFYCDIDASFWNQDGMGAWSIIFYLSKFYELGDTWLLILKGKPATFLQVYHHAMMIAAMWGGVIGQSPWLFVVVTLNSVIHTLMYIYFFIKTVSPKTEIKSAKYLTMAQIGQFIMGIVITIPYFVLDSTSCRTTSSSFFMLAFFHFYGISLIVLFTAFAQKKYKKT